MNLITIKGYHGTDSNSCREILHSNYKISEGDEHWLGDGVYFFIDGLSADTIGLAEKWAVAQSWDNDKKCYKYNRYEVLESQIEVKEENFLDLTTKEGVEVLFYLVDRYLAMLKLIKKGLDFYDGLLINLAREEGIIPLDVIKGNFYIKFEKERKYRIYLRTCNCTICVVYDTDKNIKSTKSIKQGYIR